MQRTVCMNYIFSEWFQVETSVTQGCILSALLFHGCINDSSHCAKRFLKCGVFAFSGLGGGWADYLSHSQWECFVIYFYLMIFSLLLYVQLTLLYDYIT